MITPHQYHDCNNYDCNDPYDIYDPCFNCDKYFQSEEDEQYELSEVLTFCITCQFSVHPSGCSVPYEKNENRRQCLPCFKAGKKIIKIKSYSKEELDIMYQMMEEVDKKIMSEYYE